VSKQYSTNRGDHWDMSFWLAFDSSGGVRLTRGSPSLSRNERGMQLNVKLPHALFRTPSLRASLVIDAPEPVVPNIDLTAAAEALKASLGVDIDLKIVEVQE